MTITYTIGDATSPQSDGNKIIVHICNDLGKWGRGFVMALSNKWPKTKNEYVAWSKEHANERLPLGEVQFVQVTSDIWVANMIGQFGIKTRHQTEPPIRYEAVRQGLQQVAQFAKQHQATLHMPRIGTGLAGGEWHIIETIINEELIQEGLSAIVYDLS